MKKWIVALLVLAAVLLLVAPGIVGRLAEQQVLENASWADQTNARFSVTTERFDRGWFSSAGRHRITLQGGKLRRSLAAMAGVELPSIIVETRIDHGIVPFTSLSGDDGSLRPVLARTVSTLQLDAGGGRLIPIPGKLVSEIGLSGTTTGHYVLPAGSFEDDGLTLQWAGADIGFLLNTAQASSSATGTIHPFSATSATEAAEFGAVSFSAQQSRTKFGFSVGKLLLEMDRFTVRRQSGVSAGVGKVRLETDVSLLDDRVNGRTRMRLEALLIPGVGEADLQLQLLANRLDAASLGRIAAALDAAQSAAGQAPDDLYSLIEADLQRFLSAGMELRFDQLDLSLPQGDVRSTFSLELPAADPDEPFSWAGTVLAMDAAMQLTVPAALIELAQAVNPQAGALVQMGLLKLNGENYEMQAQFARGLLSINGMPMPIPLPGN